MRLPILFASAVLCAATMAQGQSSADLLAPQTTLPILLLHGIDAAHARAGDAVFAQTTEAVKLTNGQMLPRGSKIIGHVIDAKPFINETPGPDFRSNVSVLALQFDAVTWQDTKIPLRVTVRAMADPLSSWAARTPGDSEMDPTDTMTQVGGDLYTPREKEVVSTAGDYRGHQQGGNIYAQLIASSGNGHAYCDASGSEQSVGIFSASACGLYGYVGVNAAELGSASAPSLLKLTSAQRSPKLWRYTTALLEELPAGQ